MEINPASDIASSSTPVASARGPEPAAPPPAGRGGRVAVLIILGLAAAVRLVGLERIPPGLWYDEAIYALDGLEAATEGPRLFYTTENHMREPLYIWSLGAFFALFGSGVREARLVSALWGIAAVAAFWPVARRALREAFPGNGAPPGAPPSGSRLAGADLFPLIALLAFAVFRWHVHFSRTIFRALLPSLFILLAVWLFRRWQESRRPLPAVLTGVVLGLGMYTYLSFRLVPVLMTLWGAWLLWRGRIAWRRDARQIALLAATALLIFAPLGIDWVLHPEHFSGRTSEVSMFTKEVTVRGPGGDVRTETVPKSAGEALRDLGRNALQVAGMWTVRGDHVGKHNLPREPVFDRANGLVFYAGLVWCLLNIARSEWAFLTLAWLGVLSLTSVFSFGAPNILRMQGAAPAAILAWAFGLRWLAAGAVRAGLSPAVWKVASAALVAVFAALQLWTYFVRFPVHPEVRKEFQVEMFADPADAVRRWAESHGGEGGVAALPQELASHPSVRFILAGLKNVEAYGPSDDLPTTGSRVRAVLLTQRAEALAAERGKDPRGQLRETGRARLLQAFPVTLTAPDGRPLRRVPWAELWEIRGEGGL